MLYVFHGQPKPVIEKVEDTIATLLKKSPDATVVRAEEEAIGALADVLFEQGLFKSTYIVYINALSSEVLRAYVIEHLPLLKESAHVVLVSIGKMSEKEKEELEGVATQMQECSEKKEHGKNTAHNTNASPRYLEKRNPFAITDALYTKNGRAFFTELEHARMSGEAGEEVLGTLFWAAKAMVLAGTAKTAAEAGLKPFPFQKAKEGYARWGAYSVQELLFEMSRAQTGWHKSGEDPFAYLERVVWVTQMR